MAIVAKWLTHRIVAPAFVGSIPIVRPIRKETKTLIFNVFFVLDNKKNVFLIAIKLLIYILVSKHIKSCIKVVENLQYFSQNKVITALSIFN